MKEYSKHDVERYILAAEEHMTRMGDLSPLARRPFDTIFSGPRNLFRLGVLLDLAEVGLHTVLDFGAGTCWLSSILNKMGVRTISLDVSPTALKAGQKLFESEPHRMELKPLFISYDGLSFPLENECVDRVLSFDAFHHVPNPKQILEEIYRVLRPGGIFALSEPGIGHSTSPEAVREKEQYGTLEQDIDILKFADLAEEAGFGPIRVSLDSVPDVGVVSFEEFKRFMKGKSGLFDRMRGYLPYHTSMALHKGPAVIDSRRPGKLCAQLTVKFGPKSASPNEKITYRITAKNTGNTIWLAHAELGGYVRLGAHLADSDGAVSVYEYGRGALPKDVKPGAEVEVPIELVAPQKGKWRIEFDMVDESVTWFRDADPDSVECAISLNVL